MPTKTFYLADEDVRHWDAAKEIARRRRMSMSKVLGTLLEDFVRDNSGPAKELGLPSGFKIPSSMRDPALVAQEELADDFRAHFLAWLKEREVAPS